MIVGRRGLLGLLAVPVLLAATGGRLNASKSVAMEGKVSERLGFGTCVAPHHIESDPRVRTMIAHLCSSLTPEYHLQWSSLEPGPGDYRFRPVDAIVDFAARRGMTLTGHALIWEQGTPGWGTPDWVKERLAEQPDWNLVRQRFETVLTRYRDAIPLWNVVNEPIETSHRADGLRANVFLKAFGPGYIAEALATAREFAPGARLMINEFSLEYDNPVDQARQRAVLALLEDIRRRGLPLDAFGIQGHLDLGKGRMSARSLGRFLQAVADLGLEIHVTELDVQERDLSLPIAERDRRVADETARFLDIVLDQEAVASVTTWGVSDRHSWLRSNPNGLEGVDDAINRGLPFDEEGRPKPMARTISRVLGRALPVI
jgi:endo-1,4-beta-xylanase